MRRGPDSGGTLHGPLRTKVDVPSSHRAFEDIAYRSCPRVEVDMMWDFVGKYASGFGEGLAIRTTGTPTAIAKVANSHELSIALAATNELEFNGVDWTDDLEIPATAFPMLDCRLRIPALALSAVEDVVIGLSTAYNSTLNSISKFVRFRYSGSNALLYEGSDGTNTFLAQSTGITLDANSYRFYTIEQKARDGRWYFFVSDDLVGTLALPAFTVADLLQPLVGVRKASGATTSALLLDHLRTRWQRLL
jgi:hypothetical protein